MSKCGKCGSTKVIEDGVVFDQTQYGFRLLMAGFQKNPSAWIRTGNVFVRVDAVICGACGYLELHAADAERLYTEYSAHKMSGSA